RRRVLAGEDLGTAAGIDAKNGARLAPAEPRGEHRAVTRASEPGERTIRACARDSRDHAWRTIKRDAKNRSVLRIGDIEMIETRVVRESIGPAANEDEVRAVTGERAGEHAAASCQPRATVTGLPSPAEPALFAITP